MSNIKEKLKESQGGGNAAPKLNLYQRIAIKDNNGIPCFTVYDKDQKANVIIEAPIKGILIGQAMEASSYSDNLGSKGGNYTSSYYFTNNDKIALFAPTSKGYDVVCSGNMEEIEAFIKKESTGNLKKKQVLFVLNENGLIAVTTNLSIAIDQIRTNKEALSECYIILNPQLFAEDDTTITKKAKEYLGKFRTKNPPKYAAITVGELITEDDFQKWNTDNAIAEYALWKEFKTKGGEEKPEAKPHVSEAPPTDSDWTDLMEPVNENE